MKHQEISNKNPMEPQKEEPGALLWLSGGTTQVRCPLLSNHPWLGDGRTMDPCRDIVGRYCYCAEKGVVF